MLVLIPSFSLVKHWTSMVVLLLVEPFRAGYSSSRCWFDCLEYVYFFAIYSFVFLPRKFILHTWLIFVSLPLVSLFPGFVLIMINVNNRTGVLNLAGIHRIWSYRRGFSNLILCDCAFWPSFPGFLPGNVIRILCARLPSTYLSDIFLPNWTLRGRSTCTPYYAYGYSY